MSIPMEHGKAEILPGEPYSPYKAFSCVPVPVSLLRCRNISDSAKLLFGRLMLYAGENMACNPRNETLANEFGVDVATVKRWLQELVKEKFIRRERTGRAAKCRFLWRVDLEASIRDKHIVRPVGDSAEMRHQESDRQRESGPSDGAKLSHRESAELSHRLNKESEAVQMKRFIEADSSSMESAAPNPSPVAAAAFPQSEIQPPENRRLGALSLEDRRAIADASNSMVNDAPLNPGSPLIPKMDQTAFDLGGSVQSLLAFMHSRRLKRWRSHGVWISVLQTEFADFLAAASQTASAGVDVRGSAYIEPEERPIESPKPPAFRCRECSMSGIVYTERFTAAVKVGFCACEHGEAKRDSLGAEWPAAETARLQSIEAENARMDAEFARRFPGRRNPLPMRMSHVASAKPIAVQERESQAGFRLTEADIERIEREPHREAEILSEVQHRSAFPAKSSTAAA
jgi:hypothetical protein